MKKYQTPEVKVTHISTEDIMTVSFNEMGVGEVIDWSGEISVN